MKDKEYRESFVAAQISNTISAQIHTMRQTRGWTQAELASRCDMRQSRISALEDPDFDNVEIGTLRRIAAAFDVALMVRFVRFSEVARLSSSMNSAEFDVAEHGKDSIEKTKSPATINTQLIISAPVIRGNLELYSDFKLPDLSSFELKIQALPIPPPMDYQAISSSIN
jgi:transcriptional regulator with XRE-family HTH domain